MSKRSRNSSGGYTKRAYKNFTPGVTRTGGAYARATAPSEKKFLDNTFPAAALVLPVANADVQYPSLNLIAGGSGVNQRVGNRVTATNINLNLAFNLGLTDHASADGCDHVRIIFFKDKQCNGAAAKISDILQGSTPTFQSFRNMDNVDRFDIIKDKTITMNATCNAKIDGTTGTYGQNGRLVKMSWKGRCPIHFGDNTANLNQVRSENFGLLVIPSSPTCSLVSGMVRLKYVDN